MEVGGKILLACHEWVQTVETALEHGYQAAHLQ